MSKETQQNNLIELRNIGVTYKHFSGDEVRLQDGRTLNRNHDRYFSAVIEEDTARELESMGCNVRWPQNPDGTIDTTRKPTVQIKVSSGPDIFSTVRMFIVDGDAVTRVNNRDEVMLRKMDDLVFSGINGEGCTIAVMPREWEVNGNTGTTLYLRVGYFRLAEDNFEDPFAAEFGTAGM